MRKPNWKSYLAGMAVIALVTTGCSGGQNTADQEMEASIVRETEDSEGTAELSTAENSEVVVDTEFTASDLEVGYEESTAVSVQLNGSSMEISGEGASADGAVLTITEEGTYVVTGNLEGSILVDADDTAKIRIVFNGVNILSADSPPVYIKNADKVFITLKDGTENTVTDGTEYVQTDENTVDGVIFSKADLTLNGGGTLTVSGNYKHGIVSKDDLVITGGTYHITAVKDALNGKDCVKIKDGTFYLNVTDGNGIQSKNGDDSTKGYVYICGGNITVENSQEGIEGTVILIEDGSIDITAQDDGMNASRKDSGEQTGGTEGADANCYISIAGGTITVDAAGDGIDSNGSLFVTGGMVYVSGPTSDGDGGLDYNGSASITGGTVVVAGSSGMAQGFSESSSQYSILYNFSEICQAGTEVKLTDAEGNTVLSYTPGKQYQSVVISTPDLEQDATYQLTCGTQTAELTLASVVTGNGQQGFGPGKPKEFKR